MLIPLLIGRTLYLATSGLFLYAFTAKLGVRLKTVEWIGLPFITAMGNQLTPFSGGMIARATYLKHSHALPYTVFLSLLAANYLVIFGTMGLTGGITTLIFARSLAQPWPLVVLFFSITLAILMLVHFPGFRLPGENRWSKRLNAALSSWDQVRSDRRLLIRVVLYELVGIVFNAFTFWIAYRALGIFLPFPSALLVSLVTGFSIVISITPGNWGVQEAVVALTSTLVGGGTEQGLAAALLIRAATLASAFTLGPVFSYVLSRRVVRGVSSPERE
jgi:uncharacterized membrane protein YbhN (UPF0104 family)